MRILMATMSFDIGGAETHILELCRELCRLGHDVTVVSKGGVFVDALTKSDIRVTQVLAAVACFVAAWVLVMKMFKKHDPEKLYVNRIAKEDEEIQVEFFVQEAAEEQIEN